MVAEGGRHADFHPAGEIEYHGFDRCEELDDEDLAREFSKRPPCQADVRALLEPTGARIHLYKGYTTDTLPPFVESREAEDRPVDFVFLDGGHSHETIGFDWSRISRIVRPGGVVVFDDYYENDPAEVPGVGCQVLVGGLDASRFGLELLEPVNAHPKDWGHAPHAHGGSVLPGRGLWAGR